MFPLGADAMAESRAAGISMSDLQRAAHILSKPSRMGDLPRTKVSAGASAVHDELQEIAEEEEPQKESLEMKLLSRFTVALEAVASSKTSETLDPIEKTFQS